MPIAVIGYRDTVMGFKALGLEVFPLEKPEEAKDLLNTLVRESEDEYAIIYIEEGLASHIQNEISKYKNVPSPAIILIPGREGSLGLGQSALRAAVKRSAWTYCRGLQMAGLLKVSGPCRCGRYGAQTYRTLSASASRGSLEKYLTLREKRPRFRYMKTHAVSAPAPSRNNGAFRSARPGILKTSTVFKTPARDKSLTGELSREVLSASAQREILALRSCVKAGDKVEAATLSAQFRRQAQSCTDHTPPEQAGNYRA